MTFSELTRLLRDHGWVFVRQGKGSAQIWRHPSFGILSIHLHPSKEVPPGMLASILKRAGIPRS